MADERRWAGIAGRYGAAGEQGAWREVLEHYYWDRMPEALSAAQVLGAGVGAYHIYTYRMIEAEAATRERSETWQAEPWLKLEAIPEELGHPNKALENAVKRACDEAADRFGFEHGPLTLVTFLTGAVDAPWTPGRHGFCVDKYPYDKVCVPLRYARDSRELHATVLHEYAHVIALNSSQGRVPIWLDEAVAMVAGKMMDRRALAEFARGQSEWLEPMRLSNAFRADRESDPGREAVWLAYQQSGGIGLYLSSLRGERAIGDLMRAHGEGGAFLRQLWARFKGFDATDVALQSVYGLDTRGLFERALQWLRDGGWRP